MKNGEMCWNCKYWLRGSMTCIKKDMDVKDKAVSLSGRKVSAWSSCSKWEGNSGRNQQR